jgi:hypothetical protein
MYSMCVICWFTPLTVFFPSVHVSPFDYRTWGGSRTPHLLIHYDLCKPIHSVMVALKLVWEMNSCEGLMAQTHRLAQNYHCEVWCGMHLTCKNIPIIPDRNGSVKWPEKHRKGIIAMSIKKKHINLVWNDVKGDLRLQQPCRNENDVGVLGFAPCHKDGKQCRYKWLIRPLIHRNAIASLDWIGKSATVPLRLIDNTKGRSFTSAQMFHTLAQNNHCEFWCGMHLTCKNIPVIPDRNGSMKIPEKVSKSYHRRSQS